MISSCLTGHSRQELEHPRFLMALLQCPLAHCSPDVMPGQICGVLACELRCVKESCMLLSLLRS